VETSVNNGMILNSHWRSKMGGNGTGFIWLQSETSEGLCEHGN
jgi:hypothetical protein